MDISIISTGKVASPQSRNGQSPTGGEGSFARHLQQAAAGTAPATAPDGTPQSQAPHAPTPRPAEAAAEMPAPPQRPVSLDGAQPLLANEPPLPAIALPGGLAASAADGGAPPPADALDEIRRRLALIEQAGQLPAEAGAAFVAPPLPSAVPPEATPAPATGGLPAAATATLQDLARLPTPPQQGAHHGEALAQPSLGNADPDSVGTPTPPQTAALADLPMRDAAGAAPPSETGSGNLLALQTAPSSAPSSTAAVGGVSSNGATLATLGAPLASHEWRQDLGQQLIGLHQRGEQQIELHLHPSELGPLSVSLKLGEQGAQAQFLSAHPQVRAAVEQAIPQLREALAAQGINLGEASVGSQQHSGGERQAGNGSGSRQAGNGVALQELGDEPLAVPATRLGLGQVDLYA